MVFATQKPTTLSVRSLLPLLMLLLVGMPGCITKVEKQGGDGEKVNQPQVQQKPAAGDPAAAAAPLDLSYVPSTAMAAAVVAPERILSSQALHLYPIEVLEALTKQHLGVNVMDVTQIIAFTQLSQEAPVPQVGAIIRLSKPHQLAALLPTLKAEGLVTEQTIDGFQFLVV
ncbi:MAG: hypothetical protein VB857_02810, partial [Pirellulaceae bacterium]